MNSVKTALVLSAGGMFGAYQAGAWKALAEVFRPELVAGASVGALNGWAIAGGCPAEELIERWMDPASAAVMQRRASFAPWLGLFDPRRLEDGTRELFSRYSPAVPYGATAVEVPRLRLHLFRAAEMTWRHLMACCAVPAGFPPVRIDGKLYVDGGLLGALPLWAAAEMGASRVIAVDALPMMPSRLLRRFVRVVRWFGSVRTPPASLEVVRFAPGRPLGSLHDAIYWNRENVERWITMGENDVKLGLCRLIGSTV